MTASTQEGAKVSNQSPRCAGLAGWPAFFSHRSGWGVRGLIRFHSSRQRGLETSFFCRLFFDPSSHFGRDFKPERFRSELPVCGQAATGPDAVARHAC